MADQQGIINNIMGLAGIYWSLTFSPSLILLSIKETDKFISPLSIEMSIKAIIVILSSTQYCHNFLSLTKSFT